MDEKMAIRRMTYTAKYTKEHGKIKNTKALEIKNKETTLSHITT
jgi:hypothetical protein